MKAEIETYSGGNLISFTNGLRVFCDSIPSVRLIHVSAEATVDELEAVVTLERLKGWATVIAVQVQEPPFDALLAALGRAYAAKQAAAQAIPVLLSSGPRLIKEGAME